MAATYDAPTPAQFKARFPIFDDQDDPRIQIFLNEAGSSVDRTWNINDYQVAIMYLAAHLLATDNSDEGSEVEIGPAGGGAIASESFGGGLSVSYTTGASAGDAASNSKYGSTEYGRRYYNLLIRNRRGPLVV